MGAISHLSGCIARTLVGTCLAALVSAPPALAENVQSLAALRAAPGGERRVALVIGNSAYKAAPLRNPVNDARAMAKALSETGFSVTLIEDAGRATMRRVVREWGDELVRGGVGLFYYAGHGMQIRGRNYLLPVTADVQREDEVEDEAIDANTVLSKMDSARNSLNLMILDACRNNPFQRAFRNLQQGLAQMDAPSGTLVAFATAPGSVAADGLGENGVFTKHLVTAMRQPGLPIEQLFKQVRIGVSRETGDRQIPWESSSLKGDFYFLPLEPSAGAAVQQAAIQKAVTDVTRAADDRIARERATFQEQASRERAELQQRMEQMIQEALAKQRAMLEGKGQAQGVAAAVAPQASVAPITPAAQAAPSPKPQAAPEKETKVAAVLSAPPGKPGWPKIGDRWNYRSWRTDDPAKKSEFAVEVTAISNEKILERTSMSNGKTRDWVHDATPSLVSWITEDGLDFAPYLHTLNPLKGAERWSEIQFSNLGRCNLGAYMCDVSGRVVGNEKVTVAAGTYETLKVEIRLTARGSPMAPFKSFWRTLTVWYAGETKRPVKYRIQNVGQFYYDEEVELVSYKLN